MAACRICRWLACKTRSAADISGGKSDTSEIEVSRSLSNSRVEFGSRTNASAFFRLTVDMRLSRHDALPEVGEVGLIRIVFSEDGPPASLIGFVTTCSQL